MKEIQKAVIKKGNKFLILLRSPKAEFFPEHWDFPGGKLEPNENQFAGIEREVTEETGLKVKAVVVVGIYKMVLRSIPHCFSVYSTELLSNNNVKISPEHLEFRWATREEILSLKIEPYMKEYFAGHMKFFIIHGAYGHPGENWFPWLKEKLEELGHGVFIPTFPTPEDQTLEKWMAIFSQYNVDEKTIFIGHSLGVPFILSLLEKFKAKACFLVAGFCTLPENQFKKGMRTFVRDFDYKKIRNNCKKSHVYHSNNDPYVPLSKGEELAEKVGAKFTLIESAGHFNEKAGYLQFDELLADILKEISS